MTRPKTPMSFLVGLVKPTGDFRQVFLHFGWGAEQSKNEPKEMRVLEWLFLTIAPCDAAEPWQLGFQDAATPMMQGIIDLHHDIFFFLILILVFVLWILVRTLWHFHYKKNPIPQRIVHGTTIEILWTIFPSIILMFIAIPSFALLYSMDEIGFYIDISYWLEIAECAGDNSGEGPSTSSSKPEWQVALDLPEEKMAPECLRSHIKEQLKYLLHIGRKLEINDKKLDGFIEPLGLDGSDVNVGFAKALLARIEQLQLHHYNKGNHIPFKFGTNAEKERLYSIMWEYVKK